MKLFQTAQNETINISMITSIKPIHSREIGQDAERLYTKDEYSRLIHAKDAKKCRVVNQEAVWSQVDIPVVAYKVTTTNGSVVISVPDHERLIKILYSWITDDAGENEDVDVDDVDVSENDAYNGDESSESFVKLTQEVFKHHKCPKWAKWAAMDEEGAIYVYEKKPSVANGFFSTRPADGEKECGRAEQVLVTGWRKTLIKRER